MKHFHSYISDSIAILQVGDMRELGITESFAVKHAVVNSAAEAAEMILRVDDILKATPRLALFIIFF